PTLMEPEVEIESAPKSTNTPTERAAAVPVRTAPREAAVPTVIDHGDTRAATRKWWLTTPALFGMVVLGWVLALALGSADAPSTWIAAVGASTFAVFALTVLVALYRSLRGTVDLIYPTAARPSMRTPWGIACVVGNLAMVALGMLIAYVSTV